MKPLELLEERGGRFAGQPAQLLGQGLRVRDAFGDHVGLVDHLVFHQGPAVSVHNQAAAGGDPDRAELVGVAVLQVSLALGDLQEPQPQNQ